MTGRLLGLGFGGTQKHDPATYDYEKIIGKRTPGGNHKLKRLRPVHRKIIALHLHGMTAGEIEIVTGFNQSAVYRILGDPLSQAYIQAHTAGADMELEALAPKAVDALRNGLESDDDRTALNAADKFFKATGRYGRVETAKETAEDVIMRMLSIAENQSGAIRELVRTDPADRLVDITPSAGADSSPPKIEHNNEDTNDGSD